MLSIIEQTKKFIAFVKQKEQLWKVWEIGFLFVKFEIFDNIL